MKKLIGTILLIDDDHDIRVAIRQTLESAGYLVYTVANGLDALNLLTNTSPHLIVLDLNMPLMSGEEFLKRRERDSKLSKIPVLVISAYEDKLQLLGYTPMLKKPFDMEVFLGTIPEIVSQIKTNISNGQAG